MGAYLKLDYNSKSCNKALKKAITYIGRYNGKYAFKKNLKEYKYLNGGIKYIAKKFGRFRINAIKNMIYAKKVKGSNNRRWCFNKQIYVKAYFTIVKQLLKCQGGDRHEVIDLLESLYNEANRIDATLEKYCYNALIPLQMEILHANTISKNENVSKPSNKIYTGIKKKAIRIPKE